jgi:hypothetical protein
VTGRGGGEVLVGRSAASGWTAPEAAAWFTATVEEASREVQDP